MKYSCLYNKGEKLTVDYYSTFSMCHTCPVLHVTSVCINGHFIQSLLSICQSVWIQFIKLNDRPIMLLHQKAVMVLLC